MLLARCPLGHAVGSTVVVQEPVGVEDHTELSRGVDLAPRAQQAVRLVDAQPLGSTLARQGESVSTTSGTIAGRDTQAGLGMRAV